ncbi:MAG: anion transporter [Acidobacteriota bacterium]
MNPFSGLWLLIILGTVAGVAVGRYPWVRMNRATIALVGATALVLTGALSLEKAYEAVDLDTVTLLLAMMILNANLRLSGFFQLVSRWIVQRARTPRRLLAWIIGASGLLSAILLNDTIVLMFTPLVLDVTRSLRRNPVPYLIGLVTSANIGSAATIVGNPQNMIIGMASDISFLEFTAALFIPAALSLLLAWLVVTLAYRREFSGERLEPTVPARFRPYRPLLYKSLAATGVLIFLFLLGLPAPLAALAAASILLVTRRLKPERVFLEVDWSLLVFFAGLFVVSGAAEEAGFVALLFQYAEPVARLGTPALAAVALVLSNLISNVPAVLLFRPLIPSFPDPTEAWLTLALATTFAGNLTLLGSVANLIVAETARRRGVHLGFFEYLRCGVPLTFGSIALGVLWLMWR